PVPNEVSPTPIPGPPSLRLVNGEFACSGYLELHHGGVWGAVGGSPGIPPALATRLCQYLNCSSAIHGHSEPQRGSHLPVRWEVMEPCESRSPLDCFNRTRAWPGAAPAFLICSGSQPRAGRRLGGGPTPCEGDIEVFHAGQWRVLCDSRALRAQRGRQLCRELRCGNLSSSAEIREPPVSGVTCGVPSLHLCPHGLGEWCPVTPALSPGQDSKPPSTGPAAGTIASICLALLLAAVLLLICGPPAYRRLMKRISFHRNSTVTTRPRAHGGDNDYAQPPQKTSRPSAYPALDGACRASNPLDNSSDSDYDLHCAHRV
ncbi:CD5 protein, partial [Aegotheles bennettii]|nr:CD5 protein [Aegotheles bennettii]